MARSQSMTSLLTSNHSMRELCLYCKEKPYDIVCVCGDKFDYNCIQQHVGKISFEMDEYHCQIKGKLMSMSDLRGNDNHQTDAARALINQWSEQQNTNEPSFFESYRHAQRIVKTPVETRRKRLADINAIADAALEDHLHQANVSSDVASFQEAFDELSTGSSQVGHDHLNKLIDLNQQIQARLDSIQRPTTTVQDEASLDALLGAKLQPLKLMSESSSRSSLSERRDNQEYSPTTAFQHLSLKSHTETPSEQSLYNLHAAVSTEEMRSNSSVEPKLSNTNQETPSSGSTVENRHEGASQEELTPTASASMPVEQPLTNGYHEMPTELMDEPTNTANEADATAENVNADELELGLTSRIQRHEPIVIPASSDQYAGTVCSHGNQVLFNAYSGRTEVCQLIFIPDITDQRTTHVIDWTAPADAVDANDNEWIQDIAHSEERGGYLILNRARLRLYKDDTNELQEIRTFPGRTMKRVSCYGGVIYLTSMHGSNTYSGDELIVMNTNPEDEVCKTLRDILPARINRGAGPLAGEISDIAAASNELVIIGYRLERRSEVGVCIFTIADQGSKWTCAKQLLLSECWHPDLSYTPRMEWCEKLNAFALVEYLTGHLIMIDRDGQVEGECRFAHPRNRRDLPINLTISTNDWICVRYNDSIVIHKITA